jgi:predicted  nucleic acid-binding Zn-ribbon protein
MLPQLARLIRLQEIETEAAASERRIAEGPGEIAALDARLDAARKKVADARQAVADNQTARRALEKDLASAQQRLDKYKDQLMAVKTNDEYHAMQHQIAAARSEVERIEEQVLLNLMDADERATRLKEAEADLRAQEAAVARDRAALEEDIAVARRRLEDAARERSALLPEIDPAALELFHRLLKMRQGIAVAAAADGHCTICHVRLRPQVYNTVMRNESIIQCDSCQRILYYAGRATPADGDGAGAAAEARPRSS